MSIETSGDADAVEGVVEDTKEVWCWEMWQRINVRQPFQADFVRVRLESLTYVR